MNVRRIAQLMESDFYNGFAVSVGPSDDYCETNDQDGCEFTEEELKLTKRYIELIGGCERATQLIDKVSECEECLALIDDSGDNQIDIISASVPEDVDMTGY